MRQLNGRTLAATGGAVGLVLGLAACADDDDVGGLADGIGEEDIVIGDTDPDIGEPDDEAPADSPVDGDAPTIVLAGEEHDFQIRCVTDPDEPEAVTVASVGTDEEALEGTFGFAASPDSLYVILDDGSWEVSDMMGEFLAVDIGPDASSVVGEAIFENVEGDSETGSFTFVC